MTFPEQVTTMKGLLITATTSFVYRTVRMKQIEVKTKVSVASVAMHCIEIAVP